MTSPLVAIFANRAVANRKKYIYLYTIFNLHNTIQNTCHSAYNNIYKKCTHFQYIFDNCVRKFFSRAFPAITELGKQTIIIIITVSFWQATIILFPEKVGSIQDVKENEELVQECPPKHSLGNSKNEIRQRNWRRKEEKF